MTGVGLPHLIVHGVFEFPLSKLLRKFMSLLKLFTACILNHCFHFVYQLSALTQSMILQSLYSDMFRHDSAIFQEVLCSLMCPSYTCHTGTRSALDRGLQ